jgi:hypothetical protein
MADLEHISLDQVESYSTSLEPMPPVLHSNYVPQTVADLIRRDLTEGMPSEEDIEAVRRLSDQEYQETLQSIRTSIKPKTILHAITLEDGQSEAQLAERLGGPVDQGRLHALTQTGMLVRASLDGETTRYWLTVA